MTKFFKILAICVLVLAMGFLIVLVPALILVLIMIGILGMIQELFGSL